MKGVYLCARKHRIPGYEIDYNDIVDYPGINLCCDMLDVDLTYYDFIIATPPCNYYSRANYRRETSKVAQMTKHLLPSILEKLTKDFKDRPFLVENVCNKTLLPRVPFVYQFDYGQHHFYTNVFFWILEEPVKQNKAHVSRNKRDGNKNVDVVIRSFLERCKDIYGEIS